MSKGKKSPLPTIQERMEQARKARLGIPQEKKPKKVYSPNSSIILLNPLSKPNVTFFEFWSTPEAPNPFFGEIKWKPAATPADPPLPTTPTDEFVDNWIKENS